MTTETLVYTPWGWTQGIEKVDEGVWRVSTPGHGGLKLSEKRWNELPVPVQDTMLDPHFAEEDCEESIVRTFLGIGDDRERRIAWKIAEHFERYAPTIPFLQRANEEISRAAIMSSTREALTDIILQVAEDESNRPDCRVEGFKYLVGRTKMGYGIALVLQQSRNGNSDQILTHKILDLTLDEANKGGRLCPATPHLRHCEHSSDL